MKDASILGLKLMISQCRNLPIERQRLIFRAQELRNNEFSLLQYGITDGSIVHIVIRPVANVDIPPVNHNVVVNMPYQNPDDEGAAHQINVPMNAMVDNIDIFYWVRICRFIKIMALIDCMFLFLLGFSYFPVFFLCLLSITGYVGAKYLKRGYLLAYMICIMLDVGLRIYFIYVWQNNSYDIVFLAIMMIFDLWLFKCAVQLYRVIPLLSMEAKNRIIICNRVGFF